MGKKESGRSSVNQLIQAAKEEAKKVQDIKSVAAPPAEEKAPEPKITNENSIPVVQEPVIQGESSTAASEVPPTSIKKGLAILFQKREVKDSEAVKIPRELHRELKMLAGISGVTMMQMLGNLIEDFFNENQKEITSYKKKNITGK